jgi:hypothetical protein
VVIQSPEAHSPNCARQRAAKVRRRSDFGRTELFTILPARCHGPRAASVEIGVERVVTTAVSLR